MITSRLRDHGMSNDPSPQNTFNAGLYIFKIYLGPMFVCTKYTYRCMLTLPIFSKFGINIPVWKISSNSLDKIILTPFREGRVIPKFRVLGSTRSFGGNSLFSPYRRGSFFYKMLSHLWFSSLFDTKIINYLWTVSLKQSVTNCENLPSNNLFLQ